jgi:hypothetical protein
LKSYAEKNDGVGLTNALDEVIPIAGHLGSGQAKILAETIRSFAGNGMKLSGSDVKALSVLAERYSTPEDFGSFHKEVISRVIEDPTKSNQGVLLQSLVVSDADKVDAFVKIATDPAVPQNERRLAAANIRLLLEEAKDPQLDRKVADIILKSDFNFGNSAPVSENPEDFMSGVPTGVYLLQQLGESLASRSSGPTQVQGALEGYSTSPSVVSLHKLASAVRLSIDFRE